MVRYCLRHKYTKAFNLVELSIVIVIIGLIVAGVTAGASLVKSAKLRNIVSEVNQYKTALYAFKFQYNAMPGDISNATAYWGVTAHNGNRNGSIDTDNENLAAWQDLAFAKLILGTYSGDGAINYRSVGVNIPGSGFSSDAGYGL